MRSLPSHVYAVILAGGSGTRFWPKSRHLQPKQLCRIGESDRTMLELTLNRLDGLIPPERRLIVTHQDQMTQTRALAAADCGHFLAEPAAKNTAHALALAALEIQHLAGPQSQAIMISLHADALIRDLPAFQTALHAMVAAAEREQLALLGVTPEYPETGYGYIEKGEPLSGLDATFRTQSFREKPKLEIASQYVSTGRFLWNSGIFAWRVQVLLDELQRFIPKSLQALKGLLESPAASIAQVPYEQLTRVYQALPSLAIDPAVLERSERVVVHEADIGWKDVGSWDALDQCFASDANGNLFYGRVYAIDSTGTTVDSDAPVVACLGVKDLVIVCSEGAILVCPKSRAQEVKKIVDLLKAEGLAALT